MNASQILDELRERTAFTYSRRKPPADNYLLFQQCISLSNGVEFLSSSNDNAGPVMYLLAVPGLSIDLDMADHQLGIFYESIIAHLNELIKNENDLFKLFSSFYDLYRAVESQHSEYRIGNDKYFGTTMVIEYPVKELKKLDLPIFQANYRGTFLNVFSPIGRHIVNHQDLGAGIKKQLSALYMLRRRHNIKFYRTLSQMRSMLFQRNKLGNYYRYKGETSDLIEIAVALVQTGKVEKLNREAVLANDFYRDFCHLLGVDYSKSSNYLHTLHTRFAKGNSFSKQLPILVKNYLKTLK